jgi:hypothetical protein
MTPRRLPGRANSARPAHRLPLPAIRKRIWEQACDLVAPARSAAVPHRGPDGAFSVASTRRREMIQHPLQLCRLEVVTGIREFLEAAWARQLRIPAIHGGSFSGIDFKRDSAPALLAVDEPMLVGGHGS